MPWPFVCLLLWCRSAAVAGSTALPKITVKGPNPKILFAGAGGKSSISDFGLQATCCCDKDGRQINRDLQVSVKSLSLSSGGSGGIAGKSTKIKQSAIVQGSLGQLQQTDHMFKAGMYFVNYHCSDHDRHATAIVRTVLINAEEAPAKLSLTLKGNNPATVTCCSNKDFSNKDPGYKCTEGDGTPLDVITRYGSVDLSTPGTYQAKYECTNSAGKTSSKKRGVVVQTCMTSCCKAQSVIESFMFTGKHSKHCAPVLKHVFRNNPCKFLMSRNNKTEAKLDKFPDASRMYIKGETLTKMSRALCHCARCDCGKKYTTTQTSKYYLPYFRWYLQNTSDCSTPFPTKAPTTGHPTAMPTSAPTPPTPAPTLAPSPWHSWDWYAPKKVHMKGVSHVHKGKFGMPKQYLYQEMRVIKRTYPKGGCKSTRAKKGCRVDALYGGFHYHFKTKTVGLPIMGLSNVANDKNQMKGAGSTWTLGRGPFKALDAAVEGMCEGETRTFLVPPWFHMRLYPGTTHSRILKNWAEIVVKLLNVGRYYDFVADQDDDFDTKTFRPTTSPTLAPTRTPTKFNATLAKQRKKQRKKSTATNESAWIAAMGASKETDQDYGDSAIQEVPMGTAEPVNGGT